MTVWIPAGAINLQTTLQAGTSAFSPDGAGIEAINPHHPITCNGELRYEEDGTFSCEHATAPPDNSRTQQCLDNSAALLLFEMLALMVR